MYIEVEYDLGYYGGEYKDVGKFVKIPTTLIDSLGSVEAAFISFTGYASWHIVHYSNELVA